jgi:polysaccharide deacetylase family sporulation protein PdaB
MKSSNGGRFKTKKAVLAVLFLAVSCIVSIFFNYRNLGAFKLIRRELPIYSVATEEKKLSLTFDISWGNDNTKKLLDILDKYKIKATFFLVGGWIDDNKEIVKEIAKRGHELGNHSDKHPDMTRLTKEKITQDILSCDSKIFTLTGQNSKLFRAPSGAYNDLVIKTAKELGRYPVQWNVDSIDWKDQGAEIEYNRVIKSIKPGAILLFHNTAKYTPETLPRIIEKLEAEGYKFVKISELIYKNNYYINAEGKQIRK